MDNLNEQTNVINVSGKVVSDYTLSHEVYSEGFYSFYLETSRLSQASDILPVTISERLLLSEDIHIGTYIELTGQIRSYNSSNGIKNHLILTVFAKDIRVIEQLEQKAPNNVHLNGFICKPPIYRTTPFGREIADILLAVNRAYNKSDYIPTIAWGRNARFANTLAVGDNIKILGRMQSRRYQKKLEDGSVLEKTAYEVSISKLEK